MSPESIALLAVAVLVVAALYASVGHAGASGYIAVMSLLGMAPDEIKPTALVLNIVVASIGTWQFWRAGHFSWALFWPFALLSVPAAFVGGYLVLPNDALRILLGVVLLLSAARFFIKPPAEREPDTPSRAVAITLGGGIGLLSGLTGTGGGIFLTPLLLFTHWARAQRAAAVSALFILLNSSAGLAGYVSSNGEIPAFAWVIVVAAAAGGAAGSYLGSRRLDAVVIKRVLALVLLIAGLKLVLV